MLKSVEVVASLLKPSDFSLLKTMIFFFRYFFANRTIMLNFHITYPSELMTAPYFLKSLSTALLSLNW